MSDVEVTRIRVGKHPTGIMDLMAISAEMNLPIDLEHVRDPEQIAEFGMMAMPALVIGKKVRAAGRAPTKVKLKQWLEQAASAKRNE